MQHPRVRLWLPTIAALLALTAPRPIAAQAAAPATAAPQAAADQTLPTGREIVSRFVTAIGGEAAYKAIKSIRARGEVRIAAQGITGALELVAARPARMRNRVTVTGIGTIEQGYDGKHAWSINPGVGPELLTGRQFMEQADDAWFDGTLHGPEHVKTFTPVARAMFDGHSAYKVNVVLVSGSTQVEYFDVETGLLLGSEADRATPLGVVPTLNVLRDYKKFGAVLHPTTLMQRALGFEQVVTITSIDYDTVPDSAFDPPAEVKALIK